MSFNHGRHQNLTENEFNHADGGSNIVVIKFENHAGGNNPSLISPNNEPTYTHFNGGSTHSPSSPSRLMKSNNPYRSHFSQALADYGEHSPTSTVPSNTGAQQSIGQVNTYVESASSPTSTSNGRSEDMHLLSVCESLRDDSGNGVATMSTRHLLSTPMISIDQPNSSCRIYIDHMLPHRYGFPLWLPQPDLSLPLEYRQEGIGIGDVGFITDDGGFDFLFNIWLPSDHPINPPDLPEDFYSIERPTKMTRRKVFFDPCSSICSGAKKIHTDWEQRGLSFACAGNQGAILCIPDGSFGEDLKNERHMEEFVIKSAESWYRYAANQGGRAIERNSLYLITGYMKAPSWGIATYGESMAESCNTLRFEKGLDSTICSYIWKESGSAVARTGPPCDPELPNDVLRQNQCLFVRGFKVALSEETWLPISSKLAGSVRNTSQTTTESDFLSNSSNMNKGTGNSGVFPSNHGSALKTTHGNSLSLHSEIEIQKFPFRNEIFHPLDTINELLLKQVPTARVALSHDLDWFQLMDKEDIMIPRGDELLSRVKQQCQMVCYDGLAVGIRKELTVHKPVDFDNHYYSQEDATRINQPTASPQIAPESSTPCENDTEVELTAFHGKHTSAADSFMGFHKYSGGIVSATDVGKMRGIVHKEPQSYDPFKLFSRLHRERRSGVTSDWTDPFVRLLSQWNANDFEIRRWVFSQEKEIQSSSAGHPKKSTKAMNFSWLSYPGRTSGFIGGWKKKAPVFKGVVLGVEESWWNDLTGRFQVNRRKPTAKATHQQPIDIRHSLIPYMRQHDYNDRPLVVIRKHSNMFAFSISRRYHDKDPVVSHTLEKGASMVLLASRSVQKSYMSIAGVHELKTHGLLDHPRDIISNVLSSEKGTNISSVRPRHSQDRLSAQKRGDDEEDDTMFSSRIMKSHWEAFGTLTSDYQSVLRAVDSSRPLEQQRLNLSYDKTLQDPSTVSYIPAWVSNPLPRCEDGDLEFLPYGSALFPTVKSSKNWIRKAISSPNLNNPRSRKTAIETCPHILTDVPPDSPYMLLPLWPGKTDPNSSRKYPFRIWIPDEDRLYLLLWYKADPAPTVTTSSSQIPSNKKCEWNIVLSHFHFSARIVRYDDLQGTGIHIPDEGLDVLGPLEEAYKAIPNGFKNVYGGAQLGQCFGRESGFMFNAEAMEKLDLCRVHPRHGTDPVDDGSTSDDCHLTPIGRAVLEMAWIGGMALTSFGSA